MSQRSDILKGLQSAVDQKICGLKEAVFPDDEALTAFVFQDTEYSPDILGDLFEMVRQQKELSNRVNELTSKITRTLRDKNRYGKYAHILLHDTPQEMLRALLAEVKCSPAYQSAITTEEVKRLLELRDKLPFNLALATSSAELKEFAQNFLKELGE